jgi:TonB family protein
MRATRRARAASVVFAAALVARAASAQTPEGPSGATPVSEGHAEQKLTKMPKLVTFAPADFPAGETRSSHVVLALTIGVDGRVSEATALTSGGASFDAAAIDAGKRLVFEPAEVNGRPAAIKIKYAYDFSYTPPSPPPTPVLAPAPSTPAPPIEPATAAPAQDVVAHGARRKHDELDVTIPAAQGRKVVGTQGDPIKVLENLPGLARPSFGSGQLIVWGSGPGDTRTYVDGVEVPALFHGSALRSTVNGDLVRDVTLTPGAYGADYGRSLGGVVRVETRDLPTTGVHGYAGADTLDGSGMVTAALNDRVRIGMAGRVGWLDPLLKAVDARNVDQFFAIPSYRDYQLKAQFALRPRESLDAVILGSSDDLTQVIPDSDPAHARSETTHTAYQRFYLHYRRELDDGSVVDVTPFVGHDSNDLDATFGANPAVLDQSTRRWGLRASHRSRPASFFGLTLGMDVDGSNASIFRDGSLEIPPREGDISVFGQPPGDDTNVDSWRANVIDVGPYIIGDLDLGALKLTPGLRVDGYLTEASRLTPRVGQTPSIGLTQLQGEVEPRIAARVHVTPRLSLLAAAGVYSQPANPADLSAVFGTPTLGPEKADHASAGETLRITDTLSAEVVGFYKWMSDLAVRDPSPTPKLANALLQVGVGKSYGIQFLLRQQPWHGFFGWVAYTISRSERRDTPGANWRLFDYDQPHVLTLVGSKELGAWSVGARFRYATGLPRTPVLSAFYDAKDDEYQPIFGAQNSIRLPAFWQIDLRIDRSFRLGEGGRLLVYVEGLNVTNRANGEEFIYNVDYTKRGTITGLPALAVLGARVEL